MSKEKRVGEWLNEWLEMRKGQLRPRTIEQYERLIRLHAAPIAQKKLRKLAPKHITHVLLGLAESGKRRSAEQLYVLLHTALKEAQILGLVTEDVMQRVARPRNVVEPHAVWTPAQQRQVIRALKGDRADVEILLGLLCGLRRGEICGLRWEDVDLKRGLLTVRRQLQRTAGGQLMETPPKSAAGRRTIPIPAALRAPLLARAAIGGYVARYTPDSLSKALIRVEKRAGVPHIGLHGLRHTMATNAVRAGVSLRVLQQLVGHSSFALTARVYTHPDEDMLRDAVDMAARVVV